MASKERRSHVRGNFSFSVRYTIISPEEYVELKKQDHASFPLANSISDTRRQDIATTENYFIASFLLHIDEKLNTIIAMLSKEGKGGGLINKALGVNISGAGMNVLAYQFVEKGTILRMEFTLSGCPLVYINTFGEVIKTSQVDENGKKMYSLGIKFFDLESGDQERIISCVFRKQRETIRKRNNLNDSKGVSNA